MNASSVDREGEVEWFGSDFLEKLHHAQETDPDFLVNFISQAIDFKPFVAEEVGFEPTNGLPRCRFSRPVLSTTQPLLRRRAV